MQPIPPKSGVQPRRGQKSLKDARLSLASATEEKVKSETDAWQAVKDASEAVSLIATALQAQAEFFEEAKTLVPLIKAKFFSDAQQ